MTATLVTGIGELVTFDPAHPGPLGLLTDAVVLAVDGRVAWTGRAADAPVSDADEVVDAGGAAVIPGFVDSHTHLVFGGDRAAEFEARMAGRPYTAGGIRSTVAATRAASDAPSAPLDLPWFHRAMMRKPSTKATSASTTRCSHV